MQHSVVCRLTIALFMFLFTTSGYTQISPLSNKKQSSNSCAQQPQTLSGGIKYGRLKSSVTSVSVYAGPSVFCDSLGKISKNYTFVVIGRTSSTFGYPWYQIQIDKNKKKVWIAAKYVRLGSNYTPNYQSTNVNDILVEPTTSLTVRNCPNTSCVQIAVIRKESRYRANKKSNDGWYKITLENGTQGWVSGKYVKTIKSESAEYKTKDEVPVVESTPPPPNPCSKYFEVKRNKTLKIWKTRHVYYARQQPFNDCEQYSTVPIDTIAVLHGGTKNFKQIIYLEEDRLSVAYVDRSFDVEYSEYYDTLQGEFEAPEIPQIIRNKSKYWNSFKYKRDLIYQRIGNYYKRNKSHLYYTVAFVIGFLLLFADLSRKFVLIIDQSIIRFMYFSYHSPYFWRFMRKLGFVFMVIAGLSALSVAHGVWLVEVADSRQKFMGALSVLLITFSIGWYGLRVMAFYTGVFLLFLTYFEFMLFLLITFFSFVVPSLLLLGTYYYQYNRHQPAVSGLEKPYFDDDEVERIHERLFQFRNFYPETIIHWIRDGNFYAQWEKLKGVINARTGYFNAFFNYVFKTRGQAS